MDEAVPLFPIMPSWRWWRQLLHWTACGWSCCLPYLRYYLMSAKCRRVVGFQSDIWTWDLRDTKLERKP